MKVYCFLLFILCFTLFNSFALKKKYKGFNSIVTLKIEQDTFRYDSFSNWINYSFNVKNCSYKEIKLKQDLLCGYNGDRFNDYYLEMYYDESGIKKKVDFKKQHYPEIPYPPGDFDTLKRNEVASRNNVTYLYEFPNLGKYYFRIVFTNEYYYLSKSNWDSVIVIK